MKTVECEHHVELHPETDAELKDLRIAYPHLWPFQYVYVQKEFSVRTPTWGSQSDAATD